MYPRVATCLPTGRGGAGHLLPGHVAPAVAAAVPARGQLHPPLGRDHPPLPHHRPHHLQEDEDPVTVRSQSGGEMSRA